MTLSRLVELLVGFGAVLAGTAVWVGLGSSLGWATVGMTAAAPDAPFLLGLAGVFVGVLVNVWVQETVFFGVILTNAAEGLAGRGINPARAIVAA